jgi:hypothetical protein
MDGFGAAKSEKRNAAHLLPLILHHGYVDQTIHLVQKGSSNYRALGRKEAA